MQYLLIAYDGTDPEAPSRRMAARPAHLELGAKLRDEGKLLFGIAILDGTEKMIGSMFVGEFASRAELDQWLAIEPYVTGGVWKQIEVQPCRVGPSFVKANP